MINKFISIIYNSDVDDMDSIILSLWINDKKYIKKLLRNPSYISKGVVFVYARSC